jgi:hypothetical protein
MVDVEGIQAALIPYQSAFLLETCQETLEQLKQRFNVHVKITHIELLQLSMPQLGEDCEVETSISLSCGLLAFHQTVRRGKFEAFNTMRGMVFVEERGSVCFDPLVYIHEKIKASMQT